jgi:ankyrin repeat protein
MTALMLASRVGKTGTVTLLLDRGANIDATDNVRTPKQSTVFQYTPS